MKLKLKNYSKRMSTSNMNKFYRISPSSIDIRILIFNTNEEHDLKKFPLHARSLHE